jgi:hypothetical protein
MATLRAAQLIYSPGLTRRLLRAGRLCVRRRRRRGGDGRRAAAAMRHGERDGTRKMDPNARSRLCVGQRRGARAARARIAAAPRGSGRRAARAHFC